ncbi:MAG: decaprenyl-phosphate phosphoribosyltransferase [Acidimicrobiales bacterium]
MIIPDSQARTADPAPMGLLGGLVRAARPKQWAKNVLVLAAPGAAGALTRPRDLAISLATVGIFCIVASAVYLVNDSLDVEADLRHPTKRYRPIAAGVVPIALARVLGAGFAALGIGLAWLLAGRNLTIVMATYVAINLAYSTWLKHEAVVDLAAVSAGFILRSIAGGVAIGVPLSTWFVIVASFGSLFMVAGKRTAEQASAQDVTIDQVNSATVTATGLPGPGRAVLRAYSADYLRYVRTLASAVAIAAYCLWAFEKAGPAGHAAIWFELSIAPFVMAILRYALLVDHGLGGAPEDVVLGDRVLALLGVCWAATFALGVYA